MSAPIPPARPASEAPPPIDPRVREMLDTVPMPMWIGNAAGHTIYHNRAWQEFSGRALSADLGEGWIDLVHPADRPRVREHLSKLVATGHAAKCDYRLRRADGQYRLIRERSQGRRDSSGQLQDFIGTRADVTESYETEKRLTIETLRQSSLINFGRRTLDDPPLVELAQEAVGNLADSLALNASVLLLQLSPDGPMQAIASTGVLAEDVPAVGNQPQNGSGHLVLPDDLPLFPLSAEWLQSHGFQGGFAVPIGEGGRNDGYLIGLTRSGEMQAGTNLLFARNLSHFIHTALVRDRARHAQRESNERALQSQKMEAVGLLAGGVAHDFNNLLTAIRCFGELLRDDLERENDRAKMDDILHAANHASHLVRQLLTFSRKTVQEPENLEFSQLLDDLRSFIRSLLSENIALEINLSPEPAHIRVDRNQIEQVIFNLCLNARDAMPAGGKLELTVSVRQIDHDPNERINPGRYVALQVKDDGCGMPPDVQARVFEPFYTTKPHGRGTGLGLSTCFNICRAYGGDILLESTQGVGTQFTVLLPEAQPTEETYDDTPPPDMNSGSGRVMVVDDDDLVRAVAASLLEALGYQVVTFSTSEAALQYADAEDFLRIQVLVTDIVMPGINGHELSRQLTARNPKLKTLFMSGYIEDQSIQTAVLDPGVMFLAKPFSTAELADRIAKLLA